MLYILATLLLFSTVYVSAIPRNNACNDYLSYLQPDNNPNCFYTPDNYEDMVEISRRHTGVGESHEVTTEDGYILRILQIPQNNPKGVVLLYHGLANDARLFLSQYNESVAVLFWKAGYEVWVGNFRGNLYGKKHVNLSPKEESFWNFTFHEIGYHDIHNTIQYIRNIAKQRQILVLGYSMGGSAAMVYASLRPKEAEESIKAIAMLCPATDFKHATSPLKYTAMPFGYILVKSKLNKLLNWYAFPDHYSWYMKFLRRLNQINPFKKILALLETLIAGGPIERKDPRYIDLYVDTAGSANSWKTYAHYNQMWNHDGPDHFYRMYDYGKKKNLKIYGSEKAPLYPLENVRVPVFVISGQDDTIVAPEDLETFYNRLPEKARYGKIIVEGFGHVDYFYGKERNEKIWIHIHDFFDNIVLKHHVQ